MAPDQPGTDQTPPAQRGRPSGKLHPLPNGVTVARLPYTRGEMAQIQLALLAGSDIAATGLAELSAEVLVSSGDATAGRVSLRNRVAQLGGTLSIEVNPLTTWITIRVPRFRWVQVQKALADTLAAPALSRSQIERVRDEYVQQRIRSVWQDPGREQPRAFLLGNLGTSPYIASLLDRDPSEVSLFAARFYRSDSTLVALRVPGTEARILEQLGEGLAKWPAPATPRTQLPIETRRLQAGLYWAEGDPPQVCRTIIVLPLPDVANILAAELLTLHACLTLDGVGGRLEGMQQQHGLGPITWRTQIIDIADSPAIALTAETTPTAAVKLWDILRAARKSLLDLPPTASELQLALRRARLTAQLLSQNAAARGRISAWRLSRRKSEDALERRLTAIAEPGAFDAAVAARTYLELPAAMIVIGGRVPEGHSGHEEFELLPPGALARITNPDPVAQSEAAAPWLDRAMEAIGGKGLLRRINGFSFEATASGEGAPVATVELRWDRKAEAVKRTRTILGTAIETSLTKANATEKSGTTELEVPAHEVALLKRELGRHPVSLLAACARGELRFRPVAQRTVGDRDLMILEAVGGGFDRLRVQLDTVSHLIRVVEVWETTSDGTVFHVRDAWSDYRIAASAVRAPFRRITDHDDGRNRIETIYSRWEPEVLPK